MKDSYIAIIICILIVFIATFVIINSDAFANKIPFSSKIMTFNIEDGAELYSIDNVVDIIKKANVDTVSLSESFTSDINAINNAELIAKKLKWQSITLRNKTTVMSKYHLNIWKPTNDVGFGHEVIRVYFDNIEYYIISVHFPDFPYQPFQVTNKKYCYDTCQLMQVTPEDLIKQAHRARSEYAEDVYNIIEELKSEYSTKYSPIVVLGDFNEPSHLDWTHNAFDSKIVPMVVKYPVSVGLYKRDLIDTYREIYPDEVANPGHTWYPKTDKTERSDRIDFIYTYGFKIITSYLIDTPSDHKALVTEVTSIT